MRLVSSSTRRCSRRETRQRPNDSRRIRPDPERSVRRATNPARRRSRPEDPGGAARACLPRPQLLRETWPMVIGRQVQGSARLGLPAGECVERAQQVRLPRIVQTGEGREVPEVVDPSPCGSTGTLPIQSAPAPPVSRWRSCSSNQHRPVGGPSTHPHLVALVRAGAGFKNGKLIERPDESEVVISKSRDTPIRSPIALPARRRRACRLRDTRFRSR
jgi:hypothetical protein